MIIKGWCPLGAGWDSRLTQNLSCLLEAHEIPFLPPERGSNVRIVLGGCLTLDEGIRDSYPVGRIDMVLNDYVFQQARRRTDVWTY